MPKQLTILGIHGLGDHRNDPWAAKWEQAIVSHTPGVKVKFEAFSYDDIFERIKLSPLDSIRAVGKLAGSGFVNGLSNVFGSRGQSRGVLDSVNHLLRWYAGYVVAWVEDDEFRTEVRKRLLTTIKSVKPDIVTAHSLGSLISYDAFTSNEAARSADCVRALKEATYVTLGSQLGNAFVVSNLTPGRIVMPPVSKWFHLYNPEDAVFTEEIRLTAEPKFLQVTTLFDVEGMADHDAVEYLGHPSTVAAVWEPASLALADDSVDRSAGRQRLKLQMPIKGLASARSGKSINRRALLIGINEYPDPANRLGGCVNDVFLMSSVLQECGFEPEQIRVVLNERATAKGIVERMNWLVSGAGPGDELVFFYSGHGAQVPTYGEGDQVDRMDETLVPYDFDWTPETCVTDDSIYKFYSQLDYDTRLMMIFDCCHSGGIHRDSGLRARGLAPPDDIRHRSLRWDSALSMWLPRDLKPINDRFTNKKKTMRQYFGANGQTARLGRAGVLRGRMTTREYAALKNQSRGKAVGPYLPLIIEACQEDQLSYEYRHGVESYGAFTFSIANILRNQRKISFATLVKQAGKRLADLGYDQEPAILGPSTIVNADVPWVGAVPLRTKR